MLAEQVTEQSAAQADGKRLVAPLNEMMWQSEVLECLLKTGDPFHAAQIDLGASAGISDAFVAFLMKVLGHRNTHLVVRETDIHSDRVIRQIHGLDERHS